MKNKKLKEIGIECEANNFTPHSYIDFLSETRVKRIKNKELKMKNKKSAMEEMGVVIGYGVGNFYKQRNENKEFNMKSDKFIIDEKAVSIAGLLKKYVKYFHDYPENKEYILIKKNLPISELTDQELRFLLSVMFSVKE